MRTKFLNSLDAVREGSFEYEEIGRVNTGIIYAIFGLEKRTGSRVKVMEVTCNREIVNDRCKYRIEGYLKKLNKRRSRL
jgi:phosphate-selective porin